MPYPIRLRLVNKETGKPVKKERTEVVVSGDGMPLLIHHDEWETWEERLSCADYELQVATTKDAKGAWEYKKVGY